MLPGAEDLNNLAEKLGRTVLKMKISSEPILHDKFRIERLVHFNFALLRLPRAVPFSQFGHIRPVCLPASSSASHSGAEAVTAGFGQQKILKYEGTTLRKGLGTEPAKFLQKLTLRILDSRSCEDSWRQLVGSFRAEPDQLCAVSQTGDLCEGDKGSGLVVADCSSDSVELLGVTSFTHGQYIVPSFYTFVHSFPLALGFWNLKKILDQLQAATQLSGETNCQ